MENFHRLLLVPILFGQVIQIVGSYSYTLRPNEEIRQCGCNYSEIYTALPHFIHSISRDDRFDWVFQGKTGERGEEGPIGPPGLQGRNGRDGEKGEAGQPGRPGQSAYRGQPEKGDPGEPGIPGRHGFKGSKGEAGRPFHNVLQRGSYIEVKGEKGDAGRRGRRGLNGQHGLPGVKGDPGISITGEKGAKGEPVGLMELEQLRGPEGPKGDRGMVGLRGRPGPCCGQNKDGGGSSYSGSSSSDYGKSSGPYLIPLPGPPGVSITGEKGDKGEAGPPGNPPDVAMVPGASVFKTEADMRLMRSRPGTICYIEEDERAFIRVKNGWKEIPLGSLRLDRPDPYQPTHQNYPVAESQPLDPVHRHYLNDVEEKPYYREKIRNENYLKRYRHRNGNSRNEESSRGRRLDNEV